MTEPQVKVEPCTQDMSGRPVTDTCPVCSHSAFVHLIEAEGCIICFQLSLHQSTMAMLEELREIISSFAVSTRMNTPRAGTRRGKLSKKRK